jgi:hypothetical protein
MKVGMLWRRVLWRVMDEKRGLRGHGGVMLCKEEALMITLVDH